MNNYIYLDMNVFIEATNKNRKFYSQLKSKINNLKEKNINSFIVQHTLKKQYL